MTYDPAEEVKQKFLQALRDVGRENLDFFVGSFAVNLGRILEDHELKEGCWMDVLKRKMEEAIDTSTNIAIKCGKELKDAQ